MQVFYGISVDFIEKPKEIKEFRENTLKYLQNI